MERSITIKQLQEYIKFKEYKHYKIGDKYVVILKLIEEIGELTRAIVNNYPHGEGKEYKGTIDEEFGDVLFCLCALANIYEVDIEKWLVVKQQEIDVKNGTNYYNDFFGNGTN